MAVDESYEQLSNAELLAEARAVLHELDQRIVNYVELADSEGALDEGLLLALKTKALLDDAYMGRRGSGFEGAASMLHDLKARCSDA